MRNPKWRVVFFLAMSANSLIGMGLKLGAGSPLWAVDKFGLAVLWFLLAVQALREVANS